MDAPHHILEISIRRTSEGYQVELSHQDPDSPVRVAPTRGRMAFDRADLLAREAMPHEYGRALSEQLFADRKVSSRFGHVEASARTSESGILRIVLDIEPSDELHGVRWELLRHPDSAELLSTSETVLMSRSVSCTDPRRMKLRPRTELVALIAVSAPNPDTLARLGFAPVNYAAQVRPVRKALAGVEVRTLGGPDSPLTLDRLAEELRRGVDILYLVSHGMFKRLAQPPTPVLILQDEAGEPKPESGRELAERIAELHHGPRLVVLASCESAGPAIPTSQQVPLLGHLANAGVPAILAMQGFISMETIATMMPAFFTELLRDGQIDRALAVARGKVRKHDDAWMPALHTRLTTGCLWDNTPERSGASRFLSLLDRTQHWAQLQLACKQTKHLAIMIHGPSEQNVEFFCARVRNLVQSTTGLLPHEFVAVHQTLDESRAALCEDWERHLLHALGNHPSLSAALEHHTRERPLMIMPCDGSRPLRTRLEGGRAGLGKREREEFCKFLGVLPTRIRNANCKHPVRVLVPIEYAYTRRESDDKLYVDTFKQLIDQPVLEFDQTWQPLGFPSWHDVWASVRDVYAQYWGGEIPKNLEPKCLEAYEAEENKAREEQSFAALAAALDRVLDQYAEAD